MPTTNTMPYAWHIRYNDEEIHMPLSLIRVKSLAGKTTSVKAITSALITIM